jgi:hypothetical protein
MLDDKNTLVTNLPTIGIVISGRGAIRRRTPGLPECAWVHSVAHPRTPTHAMRRHSRNNTMGCALQGTHLKGPPMQKPITMNLSMPVGGTTGTACRGLPQRDRCVADADFEKKGVG